MTRGKRNASSANGEPPGKTHRSGGNAAPAENGRGPGWARATTTNESAGYFLLWTLVKMSVSPMPVSADGIVAPVGPHRVHGLGAGREPVVVTDEGAAREEPLVGIPVLVLILELEKLAASLLDTACHVLIRTLAGSSRRSNQIT